jgi:hypothetical protein
MMPIFRGTLGETLGDDPDHIADEVLTTVGGITVDTLTDPDRYPPPRQLAAAAASPSKAGPIRRTTRELI